jgi:tellurium resistance protein TerZ
MTEILKKNNEKDLTDLGCGALLAVALGWENKDKSGLLSKIMGEKETADLDLSCVIYDIYGERQDAVWYAQLKSKDGAVRHSGDHTVGEERKDDEAIIVDLRQLNEQAKTLFFVISSFRHDGFAGAEEVHCRLLDAASRRELARCQISKPVKTNKETASIILRLQKEILDGMTQWRIKALDKPATGENVQEVFSDIRSLVDKAA